MAIFRTSQSGSAADPSRPHLILVGLPGSGKSTVAGMLARRLERSFLDFDAEISRRAGLSIGEIFAQLGEHEFRKLERSLTEEVAQFGGMVLAPGGGWVSQPDTVALLRGNSTLVYLKISPAGAIKRMGKKVIGRPLLLRPDPKGELERLLAARRVAYESADLVIDVEHIDSQRVTDQIQRHLSL
ncbi:MAG: shikimate kinase [bacterium]